MSITQKITNYYITLDNKIQNIAKIKFIDSPGIIKSEINNTHYLNNIITLIKNSLVESQKQKYKIDILLFFIREGAILIVDLNNLNIKIIFVINGAIKKKGEKHSPLYGAIEKFIKDQNFENLMNQKIIEVNLVETEDKSIKGISNLFKEFEDYILKSNEKIFNMDIEKELISLLTKSKKINDKNKIKNFKEDVDKLKTTKSK